MSTHKLYMLLLILAVGVLSGCVKSGTSNIKDEHVIRLPEIKSQGVVWVNKQLWILDSSDRSFIKVDSVGKPIGSKLRTPLKSARSLTWDGKHFWTVDDRTKRIRQIDPENGEIIRSLEVPIDGNPKQAVLEAVTWDGRHLWVAYSAGWSSRILKLNAKTGEVLQSMFANSHPRGLASDGKYLWVLSYNQGKSPGTISQRLIQTDPDQMNMSRIFLGRTAGKKPEALAFDENDLWVLDQELKGIQRFSLERSTQ